MVTGATRGLGFEVARQLIGHGWSVVIGGRGAERIRHAGETLGIADNAYVLDVARGDSVHAFCDIVRKRFGAATLLVNNAAIYNDGDHTILDVPARTIVDAVQTNALGALLVAQELLPAMMQARRGTIVNVSSQAGRIVDMGDDLTPSYRISKLAMNAITVMLSHAVFDHGIRVNSICPGWVRTDMGGPDATRSVEEGAADIVWLATRTEGVSGKFFIGREVAQW